MFLGRVLLVEDDSVIQGLIEMRLQASGYAVVCAGDGEAAWEKLAADNFDLIITDNDMPKLSGWDLIKRLRRASNNLAVILISGVLPQESLRPNSVLSPGATLEKPFSMAKLMDCVRSVLVPAANRAITH